MVHVRRANARTLFVLGTTAGLVLGGTAGAAVAGVTDDESYPPDVGPTIAVDTVTYACPDGVPSLDYTVTVTGTEADRTTITIHSPTGDDVVMADQPLSGRVPWPGAPGTLDVTFAAGAEAAVTAAVTLPQDVCPAAPVSNPSATVHAAGELPQTGVEAFPLLATALGLVLVGGAAVTFAVVRRHRVGSDE
jgi:LPXTG-motif cell wall-anchored protein